MVNGLLIKLKEQDKYIVLHHIKFGYLQEQLVEVWNEGKQPISIRVQRKQKKWYLVILQIE